MTSQVIEHLQAVPSADLFKKVAGRWATGCAVISARDAQGKLHGSTMSAVASLSLDPMQFLICLDHRAKTLTAIEETKRFSINLMEAGQKDVAMNFARKADEKFSAVQYSIVQDVPVIAGSLGYAICDVEQFITSGDHKIVIGNVIGLCAVDGDPLLHFSGSFGHFVSSAAA